MDFDGPTLGRYGLQQVAKNGSRLFGRPSLPNAGARSFSYLGIAQPMLQSQQSNTYSEWSMKIFAQAGGLSGEKDRHEETREQLDEQISLSMKQERHWLGSSKHHGILQSIRMTTQGFSAMSF